MSQFEAPLCLKDTVPRTGKPMFPKENKKDQSQACSLPYLTITPFALVNCMLSFLNILKIAT